VDDNTDVDDDDNNNTAEQMNNDDENSNGNVGCDDDAAGAVTYARPHSGFTPGVSPHFFWSFSTSAGTVSNADFFSFFSNSGASLST